MTWIAQRVVVSLLLIPLSAVDPIWAQEDSSGAKALNAVGTLVVVHNDGAQERLQGQGVLRLYEHDLLKTDAGSLALIELKERVQVVLNERTSLLLLSRWEKDRPLIRILRLKQGEIWASTHVGSEGFEVETPAAIAAIKDSEFDLKVQDDGTSALTVLAGVVVFGTAFNTWRVKADTFSRAPMGKKCTKPAPTDGKSAIAWKSAIVSALPPSGCSSGFRVSECDRVAGCPHLVAREVFQLCV